MRDIIHVLMEGVPSNINYTKVVDDLLQLPGVRNVHSLHIWSLSLQQTALSVHLAIGMNTFTFSIGIIMFYL
jgi:Co/Zn/Cd efflux system component